MGERGSMSERADTPDLSALDGQYELLGELRGGTEARTYLGKRRRDGLAVMITVVRPPNGGENNALSHFASDAQMLARITHPRVPQVLDGRWLGNDAYAVISERVPGTTLAELLSTGARMSNPNISTVLQDVDSVLEWARNQGVVHRGVTEDALWFEQGTDRTIVMLSLTPIPLRGVPDATDDARTIGVLAWTMLAGRAPQGDLSAEGLARFRPDLAQRVLHEIVNMMGIKSGARLPDLQKFFAVIATGDELRRAEVEIARMQTDLTEERRSERERIAGERLAEREKFEYEQRVVTERAVEMEKHLSADREEFERRVAREDIRLASEQRQLAAERLQFEQERLELKERIAEIAKFRAELAHETVDGERPISLGSEPETWVPGEPEPVVVRTRWLVPTIVSSALVVLIAVAAIINRRSGSMSKVESVGNGNVLPSAPSGATERPPRDGFMGQQKPAAVTAQKAPPPAPPYSPIARDSAALAALGDSLERRDSIERADSLEASRQRALNRERILKRARERDSIARLRPDTASR